MPVAPSAFRTKGILYYIQLDHGTIDFPPLLRGSTNHMTLRAQIQLLTLEGTDTWSSGDFPHTKFFSGPGSENHTPSRTPGCQHSLPGIHQGMLMRPWSQNWQNPDCLTLVGANSQSISEALQEASQLVAVSKCNLNFIHFCYNPNRKWLPNSCRC